MKTYSYDEAREHLEKLLNEAHRDGVVIILRKNGQSFEVRPTANEASPLDVPATELGLNREEILEAVHEGRRDERE